jgi:hypothetical protein
MRVLWKAHRRFSVLRPAGQLRRSHGLQRKCKKKGRRRSKAQDLVNDAHFDFNRGFARRLALSGFGFGKCTKPAVTEEAINDGHSTVHKMMLFLGREKR